MSSSDSDDGSYYRNLVKKIEKNRNKILSDEIHSLALDNSTKLNTPVNSKTINNSNENQPNNVSVSSVDLIDDETNILDEFIAKNKIPLTRSNVKRGRVSINSANSSEIGNLPTGLGVPESQNAIVSKCRKRKKTSIPDNVDSNPVLTGSQNSSTVNSRGQFNKRNGKGRARGRGRGKGKGRSTPLFVEPGLEAITPSLDNIYPTYSVGNTEEYYDHSDNIPLFSTELRSDCANDVITLDEVDPLEDNEELLVKVIWQSIDVFQFSIRKFQKLKQIFDYFVTEKKVNIKNLLFTYNDKILSCEDTPESINYSIAKFINGGIVTENVMSLVDEKKENVTGIEIKFQRCNNKNTYKVSIKNNDKLVLAMMKCAEHLDIPLNKLKFEFDGECITGNNTPEEMDFEGGECIDVKIVK